MKNIMVYDTDSERINKAAEQNDMTEAEVIEYLLDILEDNNFEIE